MTQSLDRLTWACRRLDWLIPPSRGVAQLGLERLTGGQEVASSNLVAPIDLNPCNAGVYVFRRQSRFRAVNFKYGIFPSFRTTILALRPEWVSPIARFPLSRHSKRRIPKLAFTKSQDIGWHVNYRDPQSGVPRRRRFGLVDRDKASDLYNAWLSEHLKGAPHRGGDANGKPAEVKEQTARAAKVIPGSLLHVSSNYLYFEEKRARKPGEPRRSGTISPSGLADRKY